MKALEEYQPAEGRASEVLISGDDLREMEIVEPLSRTDSATIRGLCSQGGERKESEVVMADRSQ